MPTYNDNDVLFQCATEGIMVCNERGLIVRINPAAARIFGYGELELVGKQVECLVPEAVADKHKDLREGYSVHPSAKSFGSRAELRGRKKDGSEIPVEVSLNPTLIGGEKFVVAFIVDVSLRHQAEMKLRRHSEELEQEVHNRTMILEEAVSQLEKTKQELHAALTKERELNQLKSRFVSIASHEFRTPLATILSSIALVGKYADLNDREKRDKHIHRIKKSIATLNEILEDFLSLSRVEEGAIENRPEIIDLNLFIPALIDELRVGGEESDRIQWHSKGSMIVQLDPRTLKAVLMNILANALKYSPTETQVELKSETSDSRVCFYISDHGIGIPEEDLKHIFERFYRAHNVMHIKGTGLGLNIVAKFVEVMNGTIEVQSQEQLGTTVTLCFPT